MVVLPDVRGLYRFYEELALRFAERGYPAVAFDYFGRTAGVASATTSSRTWITSRRRSPTESSRTCGRRSSTCAPRAAVLHEDVHGRVLLRRAKLVAGGGGRSRPRRRDRLLRLDRSSETVRRGRRSGRPSSRRRSSRSWRATTQHAPRHDAGFDAALTKAGIKHELVVYDSAPHSFFDRKYEEHADASADAWEQVLTFIARQKARRPGADGPGPSSVRGAIS